MADPIRLIVPGATGRMGRRVAALAAEDARFAVAATPGRADEIAAGDVLIDFTLPDALPTWAAACREHRMALMCGTTGFADTAALDELAAEVPVLHATNTSLGIAVLNRLAADAARLLGDAYDIEVVEAHHRHKKDAPSGTAATLVEALKAATGRSETTQGRSDARRPGSIGVHSLRMGDVTGRHTVHLAADGERLALTHVATSRDTFARGALRCAAWLAGKPAGRYTVDDVLFG